MFMIFLPPVGVDELKPFCEKRFNNQSVCVINLRIMYIMSNLDAQNQGAFQEKARPVL